MFGRLLKEIFMKSVCELLQTSTKDPETRLRQEVNRVAGVTGQSTEDVFRELDKLARGDERKMLEYAKLDR